MKTRRRRSSVTTERPNRTGLKTRMVLVHDDADDTITVEDLAQLRKKDGGNKWRAVRTEYNGRFYASKREAQYAQQLDNLKRAGVVAWWDGQREFDLTVGPWKIRYVVDFVVRYADDRVEYQDVKGARNGMAYRLFKAKCALTKLLHNVDVKEV